MEMKGFKRKAAIKNKNHSAYLTSNVRNLSIETNIYPKFIQKSHKIQILK